MTAKREGLASSCPGSAGAANTGRVSSTITGTAKRSKKIRLLIHPVYQTAPERLVVRHTEPRLQGAVNFPDRHSPASLGIHHFHVAHPAEGYSFDAAKSSYIRRLWGIRQPLSTGAAPPAGS